MQICRNTVANHPKTRTFAHTHTHTNRTIQYITRYEFYYCTHLWSATAIGERCIQISCSTPENKKQKKRTPLSSHVQRIKTFLNTRRD